MARPSEPARHREGHQVIQVMPNRSVPPKRRPAASSGAPGPTRLGRPSSLFPSRWRYRSPEAGVIAPGAIPASLSDARPSVHRACRPSPKRGLPAASSFTTSTKGCRTLPALWQAATVTRPQTRKGRTTSHSVPREPAAHGRWSFSSTAHSAAPVETVWPLIGEAERWKEWSWMTRSYLLRPGQPAPDGVGALRRLAVGPAGSKEEVVAWDPPHHLGYGGPQWPPSPPLPGRRRSAR